MTQIPQYKPSSKVTLCTIYRFYSAKEQIKHKACLNVLFYSLIVSQRIETDVSAKKPDTVEEPSDVIELCHSHIRTAARSAPPSLGM